MKHHFRVVLVALGLFALSAVPALAQYTQVKGSFKGDDGKPMADVQVEMKNTSTGQTVKLKTDKKGEFSALGVTPGPYNVNFIKDGKVIYPVTNWQVTLQKEINQLDVDLQKENSVAGANSTGPTEEQKKEMAKVEAENVNIKNLNALLTQGRALETTDPDQAAAIYEKATQADPNRALLWAVLGNAHLLSARKDTDASSKKEKYAKAGDEYKKAIDITTAGTDAKAKANLGIYYNQYAEALGHSSKTDDAAAAYAKAAELDPPNAAMYYRNVGITYENAGKTDDAVAAYDKSIAADPSSPDSYYRKGITLLAKATTKGDKMIPAEGTAEAFNKYLELAPDGKDAETAKQMLATIGAPVQTSYGTKTKKK